MENLPEGLSAETEATLRRLYQRYEDHKDEAQELDQQIAALQLRRTEAKERSGRAIQEYHRVLGRVQREAGRARRGLKRRIA